MFTLSSEKSASILISPSFSETEVINIMDKSTVELLRLRGKHLHNNHTEVDTIHVELKGRQRKEYFITGILINGLLNIMGVLAITKLA